MCYTSNTVCIADAVADVETILTSLRTVVVNAIRIAFAARNANRSPTIIVDTGIELSIGVRVTLVVASLIDT